jgi:hypothetical protein
MLITVVLRRVVLLILTLPVLYVSVGSRPLFAQASLETAEGGTSIIPRSSGFVSVDFAESRIGLRRYSEKFVGDTDVKTTMCGVQVAIIADHVERAFEIALEAEKGKRAILAKWDFVPGIETSYSWSRYWERGYVVPDPCPPDGGAIDPQTLGYSAVFFKITAGWVERSVVTPTGSSPVVFTTEDGSGTTLLGTLGWNYAWTERQVFGIAVEGGREWNSPAGDDPQSVCSVIADGQDGEGQATVIQSCEDRFLGPLDDFTVGKMRTDFVTQIGRVRDGRPSFGLLAAASTVVRNERKPTYNVALGPTLHPADAPSTVRGALLLEVRDITNSNGQADKFRDRVGVRLYVGLPSPF